MLFVDFLLGLGIFLYGMSELEKGIRRLSDTRLKTLLRSGTGSRFSSIGAGVISTAILQSSSMVSLLVLAFASAGMLPLVNAVGILLGANLGTTATGWIVATLGFKLDLEALALPMIGSAAFVSVLARDESRLHSSASVLLGLGLLLFGLALMKTSMETVIAQWDVASIRGRSAFVYLLVGIVVTSLIRSSSAVMMMALAALSSQLIGLQEAGALIVGADLGTTSTTILGSLKGSVIKRKLAFAHFMFNLVVDLAAFVLLLPFLPQFLSLLSIDDPLYGLVAFHSAMNFFGLLVFLPFLQAYTDWIERVFAKTAQVSQDILETVPANVTDAAVVALHKKALSMCLQAISNALQLFNLHPENNHMIKEIAEQHGMVIEYKNFQQGYENLKTSEGSVSQYMLDMQTQPLLESQARTIEEYAQIVRLLIYGNKTLKDITHNLDEIRHRGEESLRVYYAKQKQFQKETYERLLDFVHTNPPQSLLHEELHELESRNNEHYNAMNQFAYKSVNKPRNDSMTLSMLLNVNHEIHHATKQILQAVRELLTKSGQTTAPAPELTAQSSQ